ncbi:FG-GAP-like repeat-containing protein [Amycolatopsis sp. NPDC052450]|uniref:FG-GAP-like repeat-containing protein n=1 Tax=Amycolatopsis sp. NPDC052450 TaxID=3363937 RepID=UPI0037C654D2
MGIAGLTVAVALVGLTVPAQAAEPAFQLPFPCKQTWNGNNPDSSKHKTPWELDFNRGDDEGSPVLAAAAGTVETARHQGEANGFGNLVKIRHGSSGYYTYYAHLQNNMEVTEGQAVTQGQLIGYVGNSSSPGNNISPHLHYEVRYGSGYPGNIRPAYFDGRRFPYPEGDVTSNNDCAGSPAKAAKSINGDKYDDAVGVDGAGVAWVYPGKSAGGFGTAVRIGPGWSGFSAIAVNDSNADGWADLFAIKAGTLSYWHNRGNGTFSAAETVGPGWSGFEYVSFVDVNGDSKADILARDGGRMYLYIGKGGGAFAERTFVGEGWASLSRHTAADADGDGDGDIWATNAAGELFFWKRGGTSYATAVRVGSGWTAFRQLVSMDVNGDGHADLVAIRTSDNTLWQWLGTGSGTFGQGTKIGSGWAGYDLAVN